MLQKMLLPQWTQKRYGIIIRDLKDSITDDAFVTLQYLSNPDSIFRKEWSIEDDYIREMLSLKNHPVHIPYLLRLQRSAALVDISSVSYEVKNSKRLKKPRNHCDLFGVSGISGFRRILANHFGACTMCDPFPKNISLQSRDFM